MGRIEMAILIAGGAFFGAVLGRFFKILVLIPAGALAIALLLVRGEVAGHTWLDSFLGIGLLIASLELGYITGLISTDFSAAAQGFRGFLARSRRPGIVPPNPRKLIDSGLADASRRERSSSALMQGARDARARSDSMQ